MLIISLVILYIIAGLGTLELVLSADLPMKFPLLLKIAIILTFPLILIIMGIFVIVLAIMDFK